MRRYSSQPIAFPLTLDLSHNLCLLLFAAQGFALVLMLAACGSTLSNSAPITSSVLDDDAPTKVVAATLETPDVLISTYQGADRLGGQEVNLSTVAGQGKPVMLNFWAALCNPCRTELQELQRIDENRGHEISIVGIDIGPQQFLGSREEGKELLLELGIRYPVGTTFDDKVVRNFEIVSMPTTFFINADGSLHRSWSGVLNEDKMNEIINKMLQKKFD